MHLNLGWRRPSFLWRRCRAPLARPTALLYFVFNQNFDCLFPKLSLYRHHLAQSPPRVSKFSQQLSRFVLADEGIRYREKEKNRAREKEGSKRCRLLFKGTDDSTLSCWSFCYVCARVSECTLLFAFFAEIVTRTMARNISNFSHFALIAPLC